MKLQLLLNSSPTRLHNRCKMTGRPRAYYRKFGYLVWFDKMALRLIPGLKSKLVTEGDVNATTDPIADFNKNKKCC